MKYAAIIVALVFVASAQAKPAPPLGSTLDPIDGVALIGWENEVGADAISVLLDRDDCRGPTPAPIGDSGDPQQGLVQVPAGPPFDPDCLLRPGDHVYLLRYRAGEYIDQIGPYVVPVRIWLPVVVR